MTVLPYSDAEIIRRCSETPICNLIGGHAYGNKVVKVSDEIAVKFGVGVTQHEAHNQAKAYELLDRRIVRVPRVHKFFQDSQGHGYLAMEYMKGKVSDPLTDSQLHALAEVLTHFASLKSQKPGPLGSGPSYALIFGEADHPVFDTVHDMEDWFTRRLHSAEAQVRLKAFELTLCHLDLFPRNILWLEIEPPCVLDWASAGYYPGIFERFSHLILDLPAHSQTILHPPISDAEEVQLDFLLQAWSNLQRYAFPEARTRTLNVSILADYKPFPLPSLPPYPKDWIQEYRNYAKQRLDELQSTKQGVLSLEGGATAKTRQSDLVYHMKKACDLS